MGGALLVGAGALDILAGALAMASRDSAPNPQVRKEFEQAGRVGLVIGSISVVGGAVLLVTGTRDRRKYRAWARRNELNPPKPGNGMLVGGSVLAGTALLNIAVSSGVGSGTPLSYTLDGLQLGLGAVLLAVGGARRAKFKRWLTSNRIAALRPNLAPTRHGALAGASGRF